MTAGVQGIDHAAGIDRVPVNDGGDNQVEGGGPDREIFLAAIAEAAEAMEIDGPHEAVAAFPFVQFCRCRLSQFLVVDPVQREQSLLDPAHLT